MAQEILYIEGVVSLSWNGSADNSATNHQGYVDRARELYSQQQSGRPMSSGDLEDLAKVKGYGGTTINNIFNGYGG